ncbi:MAG: assembly factor cbp4 [Candelina submexicana]|nr:MAG: assembly factor cbp4 [Candelina submexicana]
MPNYALWAKMLSAGAVMCIGGPALVYYVTPTEEELFKRYNPELQKRSLENRYQRQKDFDDFVTRLKEYSKSDKPIWVVAAEHEARTRSNTAEKQGADAAEIEKRKDEIRQHSINPDR